MTRRPPRNHTPAFKGKVALAAIKGDRSLAQLAEQFDVHPIRSHRGSRSSRKGQPMCSVRAAATEARSRGGDEEESPSGGGSICRLISNAPRERPLGQLGRSFGLGQHPQ